MDCLFLHKEQLRLGRGETRCQLALVHHFPGTWRQGLGKRRGGCPLGLQVAKFRSRGQGLEQEGRVHHHEAIMLLSAPLRAARRVAHVLIRSQLMHATFI